MDERFDLNRDITSIVDEVMEAGHYASREDAVLEGMKLLKQREQKRAEFLAAIEEGIADCEAGRVHDLDDVVQELLAQLDAMEQRDQA